MRLYEIDQNILDCIDTETGEIIDIDKLQELQIERDSKIEKVALWIKNLKAEIQALKAEKEAFALREYQSRAKAERLSEWLTEALNGEKFNTHKVQISFRKSEVVHIEDEAEFILLADKDYLTYKIPTPNKREIKAALKNGKSITGAKIIHKNNIQIK